MAEQPGQTNQGADPGVPGSADRVRSAEMLERLLDLAYDVSSYLRRNAERAVRISAALLLAASLAACSGLPDEFDDGGTVAPLAGEVRTGLPATPGRYPIFADTLRRDAQGVYHFGFRDADGVQKFASASLVRLAQADENALDIPAEGDPVLYLREDTPIPLASADALAQPTPQPGGTGGGFYPMYPMWYPFYGGGLYRTPAYRDPPTRTIPESGSVQGSTSSTTPRPPAERTVGLPRAVSGRAGGTGSGTAATRKSGAGFEPSGGKSSVAAPKSSGFSGGKSGAVGGSSS